MIADADAFWFSKDGTTLPDTIRDFKYFDVIYGRWSVFGCDAKDTHPKSMRKHLFMRHPHLGAHEMSKWIFKTTALIHSGAIGVHRISRLDSCLTTTDTKRFQINHYITQSLPFWRDIKMTRGDVHERVKDTTLLDLLPTFEKN